MGMDWIIRADGNRVFLPEGLGCGLFVDIPQARWCTAAHREVGMEGRALVYDYDTSHKMEGIVWIA
jgi:hypothetical protein